MTWCFCSFNSRESTIKSIYHKKAMDFSTALVLYSSSVTPSASEFDSFFGLRSLFNQERAASRSSSPWASFSSYALSFRVCIPSSTLSLSNMALAMPMNVLPISRSLRLVVSLQLSSIAGGMSLTLMPVFSEKTA